MSRLNARCRVRACLRSIAALLALLLTGMPVRAAEPPLLILPKARLSATEVAVIVNDADPLSVRIADYYRRARRIPEQNLIHVHLDPDRNRVGAAQFTALRERVDAAAPARIQAYVLTWARPYRAGCMSITTAFAHGYDDKWCTPPDEQCAPTARSPYYGSSSVQPHADLGIRPTMALAATDFEQARALIDRGIASDATWPAGTAYLLDTSDRNRSVRAIHYPRIVELFGGRLKIEDLEQDYLYDRDDVLFYFTGHKQVKGLDSLDFVPGAIADHLTSSGGRLTGSSQMSALRWLEAGATGSYGATSEPCNFLGKFPNPGMVIGYYLQGATLLEAYARSVAMPGEGIFVGEPLAAPFAGHRLRDGGDNWVLETHELRPGRYRLLTAASPVGPYRPYRAALRLRRNATEITLPKLGPPVYRLQGPLGAP